MSTSNENDNEVLLDVSVSSKTFGPLTFEESQRYNLLDEHECFLCTQTFCVKRLDIFLKHIFETHNLVVEDVQNIERLDKYVAFWKKRFEECSIETIVPAIKIDGTEQHYFVLSNLLNDDKQIRHQIKLEYTLESQQEERTNPNFKKQCLFCKLQFEGTCVDYVKHLSTQHNLQLGKPENLVFIKELLEVIEEKINSLKCIYCEKTFTDRNVLKEHMRKKLHKRINPTNKFYDKFYIVNYLEPDKNWQHIQKEDDNLPISLNNSDEEWSDWNEKDQEIVCLYCDHKVLDILNICDHMKTAHGFDFQIILSTLDFYQKVKLVNYIRRQVHLNRCPKCDEEFKSKDTLMCHLENEKHYEIPELKIFNQPEYYFPTYENDTLLYYLEEINETDSP